MFFAILGFFVWNWPRGKIFLGDGGGIFYRVYVCNNFHSIINAAQNNPIFHFASVKKE